MTETSSLSSLLTDRVAGLRKEKDRKDQQSAERVSSIKLKPNNRKRVKEYGLEVTKDGVVFGRRGGILKQFMTPNGYVHVLYYKKSEGTYKSTTVTVHRLVALAFIPNPDNLPLVNHKDGDKTNNHHTNLEWTDRVGNAEHARDVLGRSFKPKEKSIKSSELPAAISALNIGEPKWVEAKANRYKKLIREGHLYDLLDLAEMAGTKDKPANWFAKVCSVKNWERTLAFLAKCRKVVQTATEVAKRLQTEVTSFILRQVWRHGNVLQYAIKAEELATNRLRYFAWLCTHSEAL